jgi:hypothetical protein
MKRPSSKTLGTVLAGSAILIGWAVYGWRGLVLAATVIVFWMILQFNQARRLLQQVAQRPKGRIDSVPRVQSLLAHGMTLAEVLKVTGSLGVATDNRDEWMWQDDAGHDIAVTLRRGVVVRWAVSTADDSRFVEFADDLPTPHDKAA